MSTPAHIILKNRYGDGSEVEVARFYRHWDGYPSGTGVDIADALVCAARNAHGDPQRTNRNWAQHFLRALCVVDAEIELVDEEHICGGEYAYVVVGDYDDFGGKSSLSESDYLDRIRIDVYADTGSLFSDDYIIAEDKRKFSGNVFELINYIERG